MLFVSSAFPRFYNNTYIFQPSCSANVRRNSGFWASAMGTFGVSVSRLDSGVFLHLEICENDRESGFLYRDISLRYFGSFFDPRMHTTGRWRRNPIFFGAPMAENAGIESKIIGWTDNAVNLHGCPLLQVWIYAAAQVFNSIGIAFGCLVAFSSYNTFHGPILRDTLIVVIIDALTCILCGLCVFSTMGNLAYEQNKSVDDVITDGPGLVFVVFPHALAKMPLPQFWSAMFFFMLILLGIDSQVS